MLNGAVISLPYNKNIQKGRDVMEVFGFLWDLITWPFQLVFGLIGGIFGLVTGLIGGAFGLVFGVLGVVLGLGIPILIICAFVWVIRRVF